MCTKYGITPLLFIAGKIAIAVFNQDVSVHTAFRDVYGTFVEAADRRKCYLFKLSEGDDTMTKIASFARTLSTCDRMVFTNNRETMIPKNNYTELVCSIPFNQLRKLGRCSLIPELPTVSHAQNVYDKESMKLTKVVYGLEYSHKPHDDANNTVEVYVSESNIGGL